MKAYGFQSACAQDPQSGCDTVNVTWSYAGSDLVGFRVYGSPELSCPTGNTISGPCVPTCNLATESLVGRTGPTARNVKFAWPFGTAPTDCYRVSAASGQNESKRVLATVIPSY